MLDRMMSHHLGIDFEKKSLFLLPLLLKKKYWTCGSEDAL